MQIFLLNPNSFVFAQLVEETTNYGFCGSLFY